MEYDIYNFIIKDLEKEKLQEASELANKVLMEFEGLMNMMTNHLE